MILASLSSALLGALAPMLLATGDSTAARPNLPRSGAPTGTSVAVAPTADPVRTPPAPGEVLPLPPVTLAVPTALTLPMPAHVGGVVAMPLSVGANGRRFFGTVDSLVVEKGAHRLTLFREGLPVVAYSVA